MANNYINQIVVNGVPYDIMSKYDSPVIFMGVIPSATPWVDDPHNTTGAITVDGGETFYPKKGYMVISGSREYVCISASGSGASTTAQWVLVGYVKKSTGTIYGVNTTDSIQTGTVITAINQIGKGEALTDASIKSTDLKDALVTYTLEDASYTVITGTPGTSNFSVITDVSQQVVTATTDDTFTGVTNVFISSDGDAVGNTGTVVTSISGGNSSHTMGTVVIDVSQDVIDVTPGTYVTDITLPTLDLSVAHVMSAFTQGTLSKTPGSYVTSVDYTDPVLGKSSAITDVDIQQGTDLTETVLKNVKANASITPSTGVVVKSVTPDTFTSAGGSVVTGVTQATSGTASAVTEVVLPTVDTKPLQTVVTNVTGGQLVADKNTGTGFVKGVTVDSGNETPSSALYTVDESLHVLTLISDIQLVTSVSLTVDTTGSAITSLTLATPTLGTATVVKDFTLTAGSVSSAPFVSSVGTVTGNKGTVVTSVSHTPVSVSTATINTSYSLTNMTFNTATVVTESGTRTLTSSLGQFVTGIATAGSVSAPTASAIANVTLSSGTPGYADVNVVTAWEDGDFSTGSAVKAFSGGEIHKERGTVVSTASDSTWTPASGEVVTEVVYTRPEITVQTGTITYLNSATLATVDVIQKMDMVAAVTSVPRAAKKVVTGGSGSTHGFATSVTISTSNFMVSVGTSAGTVVTSVTPVSYTVVTEVVDAENVAS